MLDHNNHSPEEPTMTAATVTHLVPTDSDAFRVAYDAIDASDLTTDQLALLALTADRLPYLFTNTRTQEVHQGQGLISYTPADAREYYNHLRDEGQFSQLRDEAILVLVSLHYTLADLIF